MLGFRLVFTGKTGRKNYNKLIKKIRDERFSKGDDDKFDFNKNEEYIRAENSIKYAPESILDELPDFNDLRNQVCNYSDRGLKLKSMGLKYIEYVVFR